MRTLELRFSDMSTEDLLKEEQALKMSLLVMVNQDTEFTLKRIEGIRKELASRGEI